MEIDVTEVDCKWLNGDNIDKDKLVIIESLWWICELFHKTERRPVKVPKNVLDSIILSNWLSTKLVH